MLEHALWMSLSSGHWYAILSSRELRNQPVGKIRFGERLVIWRDAKQRVICLEDQCPHRGAALSLGSVHDSILQCPFHGFCFDGDGRCTRVPAEGPDWSIPDHLRAQTRPVREAGGYVWLWRGPALPDAELPCLPPLSTVDRLTYGETRKTWRGHYTRCIENVIDFSHLPFVHRRNIGMFTRDPVTRVGVEPVEGGFRGRREAAKVSSLFLEFIYPNLWFLCLSPGYILGATFAPVDDAETEVYVRWYHKMRLPVLRQLMDVYGLWSQYLVFKDDLPIVATQLPANADDAASDKLVPSDACLVAFRKLRRAHREQLEGAKAAARISAKTRSDSISAR